MIIGIDPGTKITGYGIVKVEGNNYLALDYGAIKPNPSMTLTKKYFVIFSSVEKLIEKFKPDSVVIETQFVKKNISVAIKLGMARGSVIIAAEKNNIPIFEYAPKKAKLSVVGNGAASKEQVQKMIKMLLNLEKIPTPEDAADALALAICHAHEINFLEKIRYKNV
ncbi:MAG: crossover junction endodeoxyribonuclease RuvC [Chlamydiae bacterium RIFCSPHIGHO2_12_FULL_27_8]|nr:MAG: crossover junction endodeoxyribonuclease RuvC [Chlamydiae bacterium RIFCSPHIGHO2_12_FULL_27_8]